MISKNIQYSFNELNINIDVTNKCNYNCFYCYARNDLYKDKFNKYSLSKEQTDILIEEISKIRYKVNVYLLGGEPTLFKLLNYFINKLDKLDSVKSITIMTNGSIDVSRFYRSDKIIFTFTYHPSEIESETKFIANILKCKNRSIELMMTKGYEEKILNFINRYKNLLRDVDIDCLFLVSNFKNIVLIKEGEAFSDSNIEFNDKILSKYYIINNKLNRFKGWKCFINSYRIDVYGNLKRYCTDLDRENVPNVFKDINALSNIRIKEYICDKEFCEMMCYLDFYKETDANI